MEKLIIEIRLEGADICPEDETPSATSIARILSQTIARDISRHNLPEEPRNIRDINGNTIGTYFLIKDDE